MANVHKVSTQPLANEVNSPDLLLISQSQNAPYNTMWQSKKVMFSDMTNSMEKKFRNENFKDELDVLDEIYCSYLNSGNLTIKLVKEGDVPKIQLLSSDIMFSELDASLFVKYGLIKSAKLVTKAGKKCLELVFYSGSGSDTTAIDIPLDELVDTYLAGNGLCCDDHTFRIDEDIVSVVGHQHASADIADFPTNVSQFANDAGYLVKVGFNDLTAAPTSLAGYGISDAYTKSAVDEKLKTKADVGHAHAFNDISAKPTTIAGYGIEDAYTVDETNSLLDDKSDVGHSHSFAELSAKPTTIAGYGISNAYTKTEVDELIEKIDIPTVNNSTVTIKFGDSFSDSFTLNQAANKTISIPAPSAGKTYSAGDGLSLDDSTNTFSADATIARVSQLPKTKFRDWTIK